MERKTAYIRGLVMVVLAALSFYILSFLNDVPLRGLKWNIIWLSGIGLGIVAIFIGFIAAVRIATRGLYVNEKDKS
ncbi:hypothetical protein AAKU52_002599 [Pedobacter sp. CG_S7]|uniref:hypothetical protein n=1 Tax=Pedobacter sp. CG_S7 TaxID=3143930 RepID=UPI0033952E46